MITNNLTIIVTALLLLTFSCQEQQLQRSKSKSTGSSELSSTGEINAKKGDRPSEDTDILPSYLTGHIADSSKIKISRDANSTSITIEPGSLISRTPGASVSVRFSQSSEHFKVVSEQSHHCMEVNPDITVSTSINELSSNLAMLVGPSCSFAGNPFEAISVQDTRYLLIVKVVDLQTVKIHKRYGNGINVIKNAYNENRWPVFLTGDNRICFASGPNLTCRNLQELTGSNLNITDKNISVLSDKSAILRVNDSLIQISFTNGEITASDVNEGVLERFLSLAALNEDDGSAYVHSNNVSAAIFTMNNYDSMIGAISK